MKFLLATVCAVTALASTAQATQITASCRGDNVAVAAVYGEWANTASDVWSDVPGLEITIRLLGTPADCIAVNFAGSVKTTNGAEVGIRAILDGTRVARPIGIRIANADQTARESGPAIFVFDQPGKGDHVVKIQYRSSKAGSLVWMRNRAFEVHYKGQ